MDSMWVGRWAPLGLLKRDPIRSVYPLHIGLKSAAVVLLHEQNKQDPAGSAHLLHTFRSNQSFVTSVTWTDQCSLASHCPKRGSSSTVLAAHLDPKTSPGCQLV